MDDQTKYKKGFYAFYLIVGVYVAVMYLLCASRGEQRSYSIMMNLSLSFGIFSGICFVEANKAKRWLVPLFLGVLWGVGAVIDSNSSIWSQSIVRRDLYYLLLLFVPLLAVWALSRIKKGQNLVKTFVGAVFALFSLGFLPGRGKLEPLYDILLVVMAMAAFAMVTLNQNRRQRWISLLVFLVIYSYMVIANPYGNLVLFVLVAVALLVVVGILSAAWSAKTKKKAFVVTACLMSAIAVFAIPLWSSYALHRFEYPEHAIPVKEQVKFESAFTTPENDTLTLETLHGKTVVLYFWSASCGTCHAMMPDYSAFAESYADVPDIIFYAVFMGEKERELKHYEEMAVHEYAFHWAKALDAKEVMGKMRFNSFPHLTIVSPDGMVVYNGIADFQRMNVYHPRRYLKR
ncbi:MAG: TlpA family protein disulfide reductase [Bacteroidales bacterium]|nr:TlpA family protein disulfide reductase [Bacteroidales bacterium]